LVDLLLLVKPGNFRRQCRTSLIPEIEVAEGNCLKRLFCYRGRCRLVQYMLSKTSKYGPLAGRDKGRGQATDLEGKLLKTRSKRALEEVRIGVRLIRIFN